MCFLLFYINIYIRVFNESDIFYVNIFDGVEVFNNNNNFFFSLSLSNILDRRGGCYIMKIN